MAVGTPVSLDSGADGVDRNSYPSNSYTPTANRVVIATSHTTKATSPGDVPTISGNGLTWTQVGTSLSFGTTGTPLSRLTVFWGIGASPTAGVTTWAFGGITQTGITWSIFEVPSCDTTTPVVAGSFQSNSGDAGTTASVTLNTLASSANALITVIGLSGGSPAVTPRASWTEIHDILGSNPAKRIETQFELATSDNGSGTWTGAMDWGMIGFELQETATAPGWGRLLSWARNRLVQVP